LPLLVFSEIAAIFYPERVIAFDLLQSFFELFGHFGVHAPCGAVVIILLATHLASREPWKVHWRRVGMMYVEAVALALPLLAFYRVLPLQAVETAEPAMLGRLGLGIGAGVYEELVFRLVLISLVVLIGSDMLKLDRTGVAVAAVILSGAAFALHHHQPIGAEPFVISRFMFRFLAGVYLAVVFWFRGYGPSAGCHAAYNVAIILL